MKNIIKEIKYKNYTIRSNTNYDINGEQNGYIILDNSGHDAIGEYFPTIKICKEVIDYTIDFINEQ